MNEAGKETSLQIYDSNNAQLQTATTEGPTLLPRPLASIVTAIAGASLMTVKLSSKIGGFWIAGARETTLTTLELTRAGIEAVLVAAGRDVGDRSHGDMGRREAESVLERSITALHSTVSAISFFASTSFYLSASALASVSELSISGLTTLNAILGSTESSRAVAAIITLLATEMRRAPEGSLKGEKVTYADLLIGTTSFVLLQRWGRRKTEIDFRHSGGEETIWDTVVDDKGFRADVVGTSRKGPSVETDVGTLRRRMSFCSPAGDDFDAVARETLYDGPTLSLSPDEQLRLTDEELRAHIAGQLPPGARAVITSETTTVKTIKVQIFDAGTTTIEAPPGTMMVAERLNHKDGSGDFNGVGAPHQTVVFRTDLKRSDSAEMEVLSDKLRITSTADEGPSHLDPDSGDDLMMQESPKKKRKSAASSHIQDRISSPHGVEDEPAATLGVVANQKRTRRSDNAGEVVTLRRRSSDSRISNARPGKEKPKVNGKTDGAFKKALKSLSPSHSSTAVKDLSSSARKNKSFISNNVLSNAIPQMTATVPKEDLRMKPLSDSQQLRRTGSLGRSGYLSSPTPTGRTSPSNTMYSVREKRRESSVSEIDTYSVHSIESRPGSPTFTRTHSRTTSGIKKTQSDTDFGMWAATSRENAKDTTDDRHHQRSKSYVPSLYSMTTKNSEEALLLEVKTPMPRPSIFEDSAILTALVNDGKVPGMFPNQHLVRTVRRFARFASASYGSSFLRFMGLVTSDTSQSKEVREVPLDIHHEHTSFSSHTGLPPDTILLSSFYDPQGVTGNTDWSPSAISPLVHYLSVDHDSKAVVLTCRGTLGFEDVLTDMTCDYDDIYWQGVPYRVHKGIHAAARRMLGGNCHHVMAMLRATLEEYSDYGFVLVGHSLGGAVAAILAILICEEATDELRAKSAFVTASNTTRLLTSSSDTANPNSYVPPITLPAGRPIHVYSYGTPACVSEDLRLATRGLITSVLNHNDFFPSLSIGTLHDFRGVALNLKTDTTGAYKKLKSRVWERALWTGKNAFYTEDARGPPPAEHMAGDGLQEDTWAWAALKTLRAGMMSEKLVPVGEVFLLETNRVFDRQSDGFVVGSDTATERVYRSLGRPATRIQFKLVRDVEGRFGELRFGRDMFADHNPGRYEANLAALEKGILDV